MILADTSVWDEQLRRGLEGLARLLAAGEILIHPFVVGELACSNLKDRAEFLLQVQTLPQAVVTEDEEVLRFVEAFHLNGLGLGWVDAHLLASAKLTPCVLWSLDKTLTRTARHLGLHSR